MARSLSTAASLVTRFGPITGNEYSVTASGVIQVITDLTSNIRVNADVVKALTRRVRELIAALEQYPEARTEDFCSVLDEALELLEQQGKRSYLAQVLTQARDADRLRAISERVRNALDVVMVCMRVDLQSTACTLPRLHDCKDLVQRLDNMALDLSRKCDVQPRTMIPPKPPLCFGRSEETAAVVSVLVTAPNAHVAILGGPGMGKTVVALVALHDPDIVSHFDSRRYFFDCSQIETGNNVFLALASQFGKPSNTTAAAKRILKEQLSVAPSLLVLDDFDPHSPDAEDALSFLGDVQGLAILITGRGIERAHGLLWNRPFLPPLSRLPTDAALQAFATISGQSDDDEVTHELLRELDNVPLAVMLMASLAQFETPALLFNRWTTEKTAMLTRGGRESKLLSLDASIRVSLQSPIMQAERDAIKFLALLSLLPDGADEADLLLFTAQLKNKRRCLSTVLRTALAYRTGARVRVLGPIRAHMLLHHAPDAPVVQPLYDHCFGTIQAMEDAIQVNTPEVLLHIQAELGNLRAVVRHALAQGTERRRAVDAAQRLGAVLADGALWSQASDLLYMAIEIARGESDAYADVLADCLSVAGRMAFTTRGQEVSRAIMGEAVALYAAQGNVSAQLEAMIHYARGCADLEEEIKELTVVVDAATARGEMRTAGTAMRAISRAHRKHPDREVHCTQALIWLRRALKTTPPEHQWDVRLARTSICSTLYEIGDLVAALPDAVALIDECDRAGHSTQATCQRAVVAEILLKQGHARASLTYSEAAIEAYKLNGNLLMQTTVLSTMGDAYLELGEPALAEARYHDAKGAADRMGDSWVWGRGVVLLNYARLSIALDDAASAHTYAQASRDVYRKHDYFDDEALAYRVMASAAVLDRDYDSAASNAIVAAVLNRRCAVRMELSCDLVVLAEIFLAVGDPTNASSIAEAVLPSLYRAELRSLIARALACMAAHAPPEVAAVLARRSQRFTAMCGQPPPCLQTGLQNR